MPQEGTWLVSEILKILVARGWVCEGSGVSYSELEDMSGFEDSDKEGAKEEG